MKTAIARRFRFIVCVLKSDFYFLDLSLAAGEGCLAALGDVEDCLLAADEYHFVARAADTEYLTLNRKGITADRERCLARQDGEGIFNFNFRAFRLDQPFLLYHTISPVLPDNDTVFGREIHLVCLGYSKGRIPLREVSRGHIRAEHAGTVNVH